MGRRLGSKNKNSAEMPEYTALPTPDRLVVLANLIVDQIVEDQRSGGELLKKLLEQSNV